MACQYNADELRAREFGSGRFGEGKSDRNKRGPWVMPGRQIRCLPVEISRLGSRSRRSVVDFCLGLLGLAATPSGVVEWSGGVARRWRCADLRLLAVIPRDQEHRFGVEDWRRVDWTAQMA